MTIQEWYADNLSKDVQVIEATGKAAEDTFEGHGSELLVVPRDAVEALLSGKAWVFPVNGGEYTHYVVMEQP